MKQKKRFRFCEFKDAGPSPEHICVHRQSYDCVVRSIWKLQPRLRQVIEMQMTGSYSIRKIAQTLKISEPAVKVEAFQGAGAPGRR